MLTKQQEETLHNLKLMRLRCAFVPRKHSFIPVNVSVSVRGKFGESLLKLTCFDKNSCLKEGKFKACSYPTSCMYKLLFNGPTSPYIIRSLSAEGEHSFSLSHPVSFEFTLLGNATNHLALIVKSLEGSKEQLLGHGEADLLIEVLLPNENPELIYLEKQFDGLKEVKAITAKDLLKHKKLSETQDVSFSFVTPTFLTEAKGSKTTVVKEPDFELILKKTSQRISKWAESQNDKLHINVKPDRQIKSTFSQVTSLQSSRYSKRQEQHEWLGGITGEQHYTQVPPEYLKLLYLSQYIHLGKKTSYGQGKTKLEFL